MLSVADTRENLFLDGRACFAGPAKTVFNIYARNERNQNPETLYKLAICHIQGFGCTASRDKAIAYFTMASERNHASASFSLYLLYLLHNISEEIALRHLITAALQGHKMARQVLVKEHGEQLFEEAVQELRNGMHLRERDNAYRKLQALGESGHTEALYKLAVHYEQNLQDPTNLKHAFNWCLQAAKHGHAYAQTHVAFMYMEGRGVQKNRTEGMNWHRKAAISGSTASQQLLHEMRSVH